MLEKLILLVPVMLFSLTIHECAHGWVALLCGDTTARDSGRLTLNPIAHLDPLGTIMMILTIYTRFIPFGWAKPVPVNPYNFNNPKRDNAFVSLAGPASNIACVLLFGIALNFINPNFSSWIMRYVVAFMVLSIQVNLGLSFFNLIPIPPLDGSKILMAFLPKSFIPVYLDKSRYAAGVFIILLILQKSANIQILSTILDPIWNLYSGLFETILSLISKAI